MNKTKVTLGVCVKNGEETISKAIESITLQNYPHELMEIIFVDDSEDKTPSIIERFSLKIDIESRLFYNELRGLGSARNTVVRNARGKYIVWVDSDQRLEPNCVRKLVDLLDRNPKVGISIGLIFPQGNNLLAKLEVLPVLIERMKSLRKRSAFRSLPGTGGAAFRVESILQAGGFDDTIKGAGEDIEIASRIRNLGWLVDVANAIFYEDKSNLKTPKGLWRKYLWYGYGLYKVYLKNKKIVKYPRMTPLAGIVVGIYYTIDAYRLTRKKFTFFLLPLSFAFKYTAWCLGFTKSHFETNRDKM